MALCRTKLISELSRHLVFEVTINNCHINYNFKLRFEALCSFDNDLNFSLHISQIGSET